VELAQKAVKLQPQSDSLRAALGMAVYRAGDWNGAVQSLEKGLEDAVRRREGKSMSVNAFFLAMAHWQLVEKEEARGWYDKAVKWMEENKPDDKELVRFRAEAAELLGVAKKEAESQPSGKGGDTGSKKAKD
jgi:uncharacterized protein HemY